MVLEVVAGGFPLVGVLWSGVVRHPDQKSSLAANLSFNDGVSCGLQNLRYW